MSEVGARIADLDRRSHEEDWRRASERRPSGMPASMQAASDIIPQALRGEARDLREASSSYGLQLDVATERFRQRRVAIGIGPERLDRDMYVFRTTCERVFEHCESPIEKALVPWLVAQRFGDFTSCCPVAHVPKEDDRPPNADLMIVPQFAFARFRLDFAIVAKVGANTKIVAVECDGRDFHYASRDFRRDAYLSGWNIETVRASGSDIVRNPQRVAEKVARPIVEWACSLGVAP